MNDKRDGVLTKEYAVGRQKKLYMKYRYLVRAQVAARAIQEYLAKADSPRILDLGSADGLTLLELCSALSFKGNYVGIEYSKELLCYLRDFPKEVEMVQGDIGNLPVKTKTFDVVCALAVLEHLPNPTQVTKQIASVLAPGGLFIATCPNPYWDGIYSSIKGERNAQHLNQMDKEKMIQIIRDAEMELVHFQLFMWLPVAILPYLKVWISPKFSLHIDAFIHRLHIFNSLFVNSYVVGRKVL